MEADHGYPYSGPTQVGIRGTARYGSGTQRPRGSAMLMPFGKYKGHALETVPDDYLLWVVANIPLRDPLRSAVAAEIVERG